MKPKSLTLENLILTTLTELENVKRHSVKKKYLVDEVIMEISVSSIESNKTGLDLKIFNVGEKKEGENIHKVVVKLKPNPNN